MLRFGAGERKLFRERRRRAKNKIFRFVTGFVETAKTLMSSHEPAKLPGRNENRTPLGQSASAPVIQRSRKTPLPPSLVRNDPVTREEGYAHKPNAISEINGIGRTFEVRQRLPHMRHDRSSVGKKVNSYRDCRGRNTVHKSGSKNNIGSVDPDALKISARRSTLTENARLPFHVEPEHMEHLAA